MKRIFIAAAAAALAATGSIPATAQDSAADAPQLSKGEQRLAKLLEGRVAGEPQSCISTFNDSDLQVIDRVGFVYGRGKTIYVARAVHPDSLGPWDVPVIKRWGSQLCHTDMIHTVDRSSGMTTGVVFLENFVPYTRVSEDG